MRKVAVVSKQPNSRMCFVCGLENRAGLHSRFYQLASGELLALFRPREEHQGYPGRLHGGLAATILDETIGRVMMTHEDESLWGVTVEFSLRLHRPVPLDREIRVLARVTRDRRRIFEGWGGILLDDGQVAVEGWGKYLKMDIDRIAEFDREEQQWGVREEESDPRWVMLPEIDTEKQHGAS